MLMTKRLSIVPTERCTLRCKLCSNHMPSFKNPLDASYDELVRDIDRIFELFDKIEWLQFVGGEIFLHKDMEKIYRYCKKYLGKFDKLIIETNATILPQLSTIEALSEYGENVKVMISDYGKLSYKKNEFIALLEKNDIPYVLKVYNGEDQHFGGWIDNTNRCDLGQSDSVVQEKSAKCPQVRLENMHCFRGKLHRCSNSLFLSELNIFEPNELDVIDLHDENTTIEEKRDILKSIYQHPLKSCHYCSWKDADSLPRYPAAEQMD